MLNYQRFQNNQAPTLVLLHGFMGCLSDWSEVIAHLQDRFDIIAIDLPGHGQSPCPDQLSFESVSKMIHDVLEAEEVSRITLCGYSFGARLAMAYHRYYPNTISALYLLAGHPGILDDTEHAKRREWDLDMAGKLRELPYSDFLRDWYALPVFESLQGSDHFASLAKRRIEMARPDDYATVITSLGSGSQPMFWDDLAQSRVPITYISGALDDRYTAIGIQLMMKNPSIKLMTLSGVGHAAFIEDPSSFAAIL